jgi:hypothetical protein
VTNLDLVAFGCGARTLPAPFLPFKHSFAGAAFAAAADGPAARVLLSLKQVFQATAAFSEDLRRSLVDRCFRSTEYRVSDRTP